MKICDDRSRFKIAAMSKTEMFPFLKLPIKPSLNLSGQHVDKCVSFPNTKGLPLVRVELLTFSQNHTLLKDRNKKNTRALVGLAESEAESGAASQLHC